MRIVIATRIYSPEPSAAAFFLKTVAEELAAAGHDVRVLTTPMPKTIQLQDSSTVSVRRFPVMRDRNGYVRGYLQYLSFDISLTFRLLFGRKADLYFVEPPPTTGAVVRVIAWLRKTPYVYDVADIWSDAARMTTSSKIVLGLLRWIELFALRGAHHGVTISDHVLERVRELGIDIPMTVVGFGADIMEFNYSLPEQTPMSLSRLAAQDHTPYFLYAGNHSEWQGAGVFIDGFARFSSYHPGYRLTFVGHGTEKESLKQHAIALGLDTVEFYDAIPAQQLAPLLHGAIASLASLKPGIGYDYAFASKLYSSFAAGCPVVFAGPGPTAQFIGVAELSQRSGIAVDYDPESIAKALFALTASPFTPAERERLAKWTAENHSLQAAALKVVHVVEQSATEPRQ